jgi:hypothetical protein
MAASLRVAGTRADGTTASLSPSYPAGIVAGDLIQLHAFFHEGTTTTVGTWAIPAGFSLVRRQNLTVGGAKKGELAIFARRATGAESGSVTVTRTGATGNATVATANMTVWQGVNGTTDLDGLEGITSVADEATPYAMTVTTLGADRLVIGWVFANDNLASTGVSAGWTNVVAPYTDPTGADYAGHIASIVKAAAGGQAGSWTQSAGIEGALIGVALIPAPIIEQHSGAGAISQTSSTAATGARAAGGAGSVSQTSSVTATGKKGSSSTAAISQTSTVAATGQIPGPELSGVANISQPSTGAATGRKQAGGTAAIAQSHSATATGFKAGGFPQLSGSASISQPVTVSATARKSTGGAASISQSHGTAATGREGGFAAPSIIQPSTAAATGRRGSSGAGSITVAHTITAAGIKGARGVAAIAQPSSSTAVGPIIRYGTAAIAQTHTIEAVGEKSGQPVSTFELVSRIGRMLEPPRSLGMYGAHLTISGADVDDTGAEPFIYKPNTLYLWLEDDEEIELSPEARQHNFVIRALFTTDSLDEEPQHRRRRDVSITLDTKRKEYLARIEAAMIGEDWQYISGSADWDAIRALEGRGIAVLIRGYRHLSIA